MVEVERHQRHGCAPAVFLLDRLLERAPEQRPVGQAGERIGHGQRYQPTLLRLDHASEDGREHAHRAERRRHPRRQ
ncbi:MAG: hypothetical protein WCE38_07865 [Burkholderiales bacterium]